ncbi:hypothetical protein [Cellulomonas endophytica]|uniref:hypothetical protein n=1 Tax=Cellulomonas endophytica TaxID=2494735 RepID=UPI0010133F8F|nr:hypothetical protein [Cellulomonas endophytica]
MPLRRAGRPPGEVLALLPRGDRALDAVVLADGRWAVVARTVLLVAGADGAGGVARPWTDVDRGSLDPEAGGLTVHWVDGTRTALPLVDSGAAARWARSFRERVQQSVVRSLPVTGLPGRPATPPRVALRRAADGTLFTQLLGDARVDLADPATLAAVVAVEDELRSSAGLPR